ncbi:DGQHR domain-containing protein [Polymorphobacter arshaanensis]|uniref:DGQHR domain-containing protein n=1 Tax=Glacieibacterium arshaanense TaxID=2511025 RepID=A0A4Y9EQ89_9SPHN|nr:DGQHR domain-containing protein [Polymorphobacter arshaanensis]TFU05765.1 DGQHR domain-containing protein [Polymorphobacter arshaanensis]
MGEFDDFEDLKSLEGAGTHVAAFAIPIVVGPKLSSGVQLISGFIPVKALLGRFTVPSYNPVSRIGYQRMPGKARVNQLAAALRAGSVDLPNSVILNIRSQDAASMVSGGHLHLPGISGNPTDDQIIHVVDGQHRVLALSKAVSDGWEYGEEYLLPFVCMLGGNELEEMKQFYLVNSNAKPVRTDLALALMKRMSVADPSVMDELEGKGRAWQINGQTLVERLANESGIWRLRIRLPGMDKGQTTMPSASMVKSLQGVLKSPFFQRLNQDQQVRILEAYWEGVRQVLPAAFSNAEDYTIMKGVGVRVLHNLLPDVIEIIRDSGKSTADPNNYEEVLAQPLLEVSGYDSEGDEVTGDRFWLSGAEGGAGSFSSESGINRLTASLQKALPNLEIG